MINLKTEEFVLDMNTLQALQQLLQWVGDFVLYLLASLPNQVSPGLGPAPASLPNQVRPPPRVGPAPSPPPPASAPPRVSPAPSLSLSLPAPASVVVGALVRPCLLLRRTPWLLSA